ncbi:hypothetical protein [Thaumasiovibrio subtropicus]|uniref:hypothetical protein n=1 Tax=Thaumasiovibrio subtropicus TaxID=1891207 RepID=UPI000B361077|nr:hypothetical protein [Thaumasiovibrio subtropicus]
MDMTIELVTYKLNQDITEQELSAANEECQTFVLEQDGFLYRSVSVDRNSNTWTDIVYWATMENAQQAGEAFMKSDHTKNLMRCIDPESVVMTHHQVLNSFESETCKA